MTNSVQPSNPPNPQPDHSQQMELRPSEGISTLFTEIQFKSWWRIVAAGAMALTLAILFVVSLWLIGRAFALLVLAATIAAALSPVVSYLERWLRRTPAVILVYLFLLLVLLILAMITIPPFVQQARELGAQIPMLIEEAELWIAYWDRVSQTSLQDMLVNQIELLAAVLAGIPLGIISSIAEIIVMIFISIYLLLELPAIRRFILSLFDEDRAGQVDEVLAEMGAAMGGYVRGTMLSGMAVAIIAYIGLLLLGFEYALVLALLAGFMELIPYLGPLLAGIPIVGFGFLDSPTTGLITLAFWLVLQQVESNILLPNIMRTQTEISPLLVLLAVAIGYSIGGLLGAIVAIPITGAGRVFVQMVVAPAIRRWTGATQDAPKHMRVEREG